jgi:hypothetical protein
MAQIYVAGICNIGPEEIRRRRATGWVGLIVAVIVFAVLFWIGVNPLWRLFVFFPAALSATGFLQAYFQFCTGFARRGIFNFGTAGQTNAVADDTSKAKDRKRGNRITLYAVTIGIVVAIVCVII